MKKLLLTSNGISSPKIRKEFLRLLDKPVSEIKVLIMHTARTRRHKGYLIDIRKKLKACGIKKRNIIPSNICHNIKAPKKIDFDVFYSCGGNTFYILNRVKKTGFDKLIKKFVNKGGLYVGVSAGSMIVHKTIKGADGGSEGDPNNIGLKNLNGLNLTNIAIFPHFKKRLAKEVNQFRKTINYPVIALKDKQALLILGNKIKKL